MTDTLRVELGERSYDIVIGPRLLAQAGMYLKPFLENRNGIIICDEHVARLYLHRLTGALEEAGLRARTIVIPPGEGSKSLASFADTLERVLELSPDRRSMILALGGGVVGDLAGFAASVLLRGIDFIQLPTTLLAQVDSSVGGKTGVNSRWGKNLIGSFHQPKLVLADIGALSSLPERELKAGYAEVVKYGLLGDAGFFSWLEEHGKALLAGDAALRGHAVLKSCEAKARIVAADEKEQGLRALLNLGHTFGHALEAETGFSEALLHGEAVAIGMILALRLSVKMGLCPATDLERVLAHYEAVGLPASPLAIRPDWDVEKLMAHFTRDKKAKSGVPHFILLRGIGDAFVTADVQADMLRELLSQTCKAG